MTSTLYVEPDDPTPAQIVARRIRGLVAERQIVGQQLAAALGMPQPSFSRRYRGVTPWTIDELYELAAVLGINVGDLLPRLDSNQQPFGSPSTQVTALPARAVVAEVLPAAEGPAGLAAAVVHLDTWRRSRVVHGRGRRTA